MFCQRLFYFFKKFHTWYMHGITCYCPIGLLPHFYLYVRKIHCSDNFCVNALSGCYLISTVPLQKPRFYAASRACFCRYLSEYSDNSCFSCMLTIWTYFMRYTYPWHCIKYSTKCSCCHPIFNNFKSLLLLFSLHPFTSSF